MAPPPMMNNGNTTTGMGMGMPREKKKMMMHMTFYWGKDALILFTGWPGRKTGMYYLALLFVFSLGIIVEWLAYCNIVMMKSNGVSQTLVYALRVGLTNMVMLALMSFNVGVFLMAVLGHALGFFFFRVVMKPYDKTQHVISTAC